MAIRSQMSIRRAAFINIASKLSSALLQLAYLVILARLLTPEDFGIVAIAQVFVVFFGLFADMGLGSAIIQKQDLEEADVSKLFGFTLILGAILALIFCLIGYPVAAIYQEVALLDICCLLAISVFFATTNTIPNALLMKQKRFLRAGIRQITSVLISSILAIACAAMGAGYWAIVIYSIANSLLIFLWNYLTNFIRPTFRGLGSAVKKVFNYSAYVFGFNLTNYFFRNLDKLLVGYYFGTASLGNYSKAYQLMQYPQMFLTAAVTPVLHPILAERQQETDYIYGVFIKTVKILSLSGVFASVFFFFCAEEVVLIMYGEQWHGAVPCLQFLAVSIWSQMICGTSGTMFQVLNRTKEQFIRGIIFGVIVCGSIIVGVYIGSVEAVAALVGVSYYAAFVLLCPFLIKISFGKSIRAFLKVFIPDAVIAGCYILFFMLLQTVPIEGVYLSFLIKLVFGLVVYFALLALLRQTKWYAPILPEKLKRKLPKWLIK